MKQVTLLFLRRGDELLLAMKKRGFGAGKWNGTGGKLEPGETALQAAIRETEEEIGVTPLEPRCVGKIDFYLTADPDFHNHTSVFVADTWHGGEPRETEEMRPQWFPIAAIPYDEMWGDDRLWLPELLAGHRFRAAYTIDGNNTVARGELHILTGSEELTA